MPMRFVDLFAGLGGFHLALRRLGHTCVFACEVDETLRTLYEKNFGTQCAGDIRKIREIDVPPHDILCAGFPCQPFSKAGDQDGLGDRELGGLYKDMLRIIRFHKPRFLILENVPFVGKDDRCKIGDSGFHRQQPFLNRSIDDDTGDGNLLRCSGDDKTGTGSLRVVSQLSESVQPYHDYIVRSGLVGRLRTCDLQ